MKAGLREFIYISVDPNACERTGQNYAMVIIGGGIKEYIIFTAYLN